MPGRHSEINMQQADGTEDTVSKDMTGLEEPDRLS
jgi:hypothetical protein